MKQSPSKVKAEVPLAIATETLSSINQLEADEDALGANAGFLAGDFASSFLPATFFPVSDSPAKEQQYLTGLHFLCNVHHNHTSNSYDI